MKHLILIEFQLLNKNVVFVKYFVDFPFVNFSQQKNLLRILRIQLSFVVVVQLPWLQLLCPSDVPNE